LQTENERVIVHPRVALQKGTEPSLRSRLVARKTHRTSWKTEWSS
jgi:hypothetical protein